jgi:hypothetical protein
LKYPGNIVSDAPAGSGVNKPFLDCIALPLLAFEFRHDLTALCYRAFQAREGWRVFVRLLDELLVR